MSAWHVLSFIMLLSSSVVSANCQVIEGVKGVNVRSASSSDSSKVGYLSPGEKYPIIKKDGSWVNFWFDGAARWSFAPGYLKESSGTCISLQESTQVVEQNSPANVLGNAPAGSIWVVNNHNSEWLDIWFGGKKGWVATSALSQGTKTEMHIPSQHAFVGTTFNYYFQKPESAIGVTLKSGPDGMRYEQGKLQWVPASGNVGNHEIELALELLTGAVSVQNINLIVHDSQTANCSIAESIKGVNVRSGNSSSDDKVSYINVGEQYPIIGSEGNWLNIWHDGQPRWSYSKGYLNTSDGRCLNTTDFSAVYMAPDSNSSQLGRVEPNSKWVVTQETNDWYQVWYLGQSGYIAKAKASVIPLEADWSFISTPNIRTAPQTTYYYVPQLKGHHKGIRFNLDEAPDGMSLEGGVITWLPSESDSGEHFVTLRALDLVGSELIQSFSIEVSQLYDEKQCEIVEAVRNVNVRTEANGSSQKVGYITVGEQYTVLSEQGNWVNIWYDGAARWAYGAGYLKRSNAYCITAEQSMEAQTLAENNNIGVAQKDSKWVVLQKGVNTVVTWFGGELVKLFVSDDTDTTNDNLAFTSEPPSAVGVSQEFNYQISSNWSLPVTYEILSAPVGMYISENRLIWEPSSAQIGQHNVEIMAVTTGNLTAIQKFSVEVAGLSGVSCKLVESIRGVNVRDLNSTSGNKVGYIQSGQRYAYLDQKGAWYQIWFDGETKWAYGPGYLEFVDGACSHVDQNSGNIVYQFASEKAPQLGAVPYGSQWSISTENSGWVKVWYAGQVGYIKKASRDPQHDVPVITSLPIETATANQVYRYQIELASLDSSITYILKDSPAGMSISAAGLIEWYPGINQIGQHSVTVVATRNGKEAPQVFAIDVAPEPFITQCSAVTVKSDTYIKANAVQGSRTIGIAKVGQRFLLDEQENGFSKIVIEDLAGWVPQSSLGESFGTACLTVISEGGSGYENPDLTSYPFLSSLYIGSKYFVVDHQDGWYKVEYHDAYDRKSYAWVQASFVQALGVNNAPKFVDKHVVLKATRDQLFVYTPILTRVSTQQKFALLRSPEGMQIDEESGAISWLPDVASKSLVEVEIRVLDGIHFDLQSIELSLEEKAQQCSIIETVGRTGVFDSAASSSVRQYISAGQQYVIVSMTQERVEIHFDDSTKWVELAQVQRMDSDHCTSTGARNVEVIHKESEFNEVPLGYASRGSSWVVTKALDSQFGIWFDGKLGWLNSRNVTSVFPKAVLGKFATILAGQAFTLYGLDSFSSNGQELKEYQWRINGLLVSKQAVYEVSELPAGEHVITLSVVDNNGQTHSSSRLIKVLQPGSPIPKFTSIPKVTAISGTLYHYQLQHSLNDHVSYELLKGPEGMVVSQSGLISWNVPGNWGSHQIEVAATSQAGTTLIQRYLLGVSDDNRPPSIHSNPALSAVVGYEYQYQAVASDTDGYMQLYLASAPSGMILDRFNKIRWIPRAEDMGTQSVVLVAYDGIETVQQAFTIEVEKGNDQDEDGIPDVADLCLETNSVEGLDRFGCSIEDLNNNKLTSKNNIPKTGQAQSLAPFDDGFYQQGRERSYVELQDGLISDQNSMLIWADLATEHRAQGLSWHSAVSYCENLNHAGIDSWRLPLEEELFFLLDRSDFNSGLLPAEFNSRGSSKYWSAELNTLLLGDDSTIQSATQIDLSTGLAYSRNNVKYAKGNALCVTGEVAHQPSYKQYEYGVYDQSNLLVWQKKARSSDSVVLSSGWHQAVQYCENLQEAGFDDWRLPNINELYSLAHDQSIYAVQFSELFNKWSDYSFWSSTKTDHNNNAYLIKKDGHSFIHVTYLPVGLRSADIPQRQGLVRCVRDWQRPKLKVDYNSVIRFGELLHIDASESEIYGFQPEISWRLACKSGHLDCSTNISSEHNLIPDLGEWSLLVTLRRFGFKYDLQLPVTVIADPTNTPPTVEDLHIIKRISAQDVLGHSIALDVEDPDLISPTCPEPTVYCRARQRLRVEVVEMPKLVELGKQSATGNQFIPFESGDWLPTTFKYRALDLDRDVADEFKVRVYDGQNYSRIATIKLELRHLTLNELANLGPDIGLLSGSDYLLQPVLLAQGADYGDDLKFEFSSVTTGKVYDTPSLMLTDVTADDTFQLNITDPQGNLATSSIQVVVARPLPSSLSLLPGEHYRFFAHKSTNQYGKPVFGQLEWYINEEPWRGVNAYSPFMNFAKPPGTYKVKIVLKDSLGNPDEYVSTVTVTDWPTDIGLSNLIFTEGEANFLPKLELFKNYRNNWVVDGKPVPLYNSRYKFDYPAGQYEGQLHITGELGYSKVYPVQITVQPKDNPLPENRVVAVHKHDSYTLSFSDEGVDPKYHRCEITRLSDGRIWAVNELHINNIVEKETYQLKATHFDGISATGLITIVPARAFPDVITLNRFETKKLTVHPEYDDAIFEQYQWLLDGIEVGTEPSFLFSKDSGDYSLELKIVDAKGQSKVYPVKITVLPENIPLPENRVVAIHKHDNYTLSFSDQGIDPKYHRFEITRLSDGRVWAVNELHLNKIVEKETYQLKATRFDGKSATGLITIILVKPFPDVITVDRFESKKLSVHPDHDGAIFKQYQWLLDGIEVGTEHSFLFSEDYGDYTLELKVVDEKEQSYTYRTTLRVRATIESCKPNRLLSDEKLEQSVPEENIDWIGATYHRVEDIEVSFNNARRQDKTVEAELHMPAQSVWDAWSAAEKVLYLINAERTARGIEAFYGVTAEFSEITQKFAQYSLENDLFSHYRTSDGATPHQRVIEHFPGWEEHSKYWGVREVLALSSKRFFSTADLSLDEQISAAAMLAVYDFIYADKFPYTGEAWGHRNAVLGTVDYPAGSLPQTRGLLGVGSIAGPFTPNGDKPQSVESIWTGVNLVNVSKAWPELSITRVDHSAATRCDKPIVPLEPVPQLIALEVAPQTLHLVPGMSEKLTITATYSNGHSEPVNQSVSMVELNRRVFSFKNGTVTAKSNGISSLTVLAGEVESNTIQIVVSEKTQDTKESEGFAGEHHELIADNASAEQFPVNLFAVYTGEVFDTNDQPLANAQVSFLGQDEFGSVKTDDNGRYSIAGMAGKSTLDISLPGYLRVQREIIALNKEWNSVDRVTLQPLDALVTLVDLTSDGPKVHKSNPVSDEFGVRSTSLVFEEVNQAKVVAPNGQTRTLDKIAVRATEYETPETMPGALPVESAFTYCAELDIAGVADNESVHFDQPVVMYVDNFLDFPVGELVPIGYYDRQEAKWKASENGVVVRLLDTNGDGEIDGVDYTGDEQPDDIDGDGSVADESKGIENYEAGKTYWRGRMFHFTPYDFNWSARSDGTPPTEVEVLTGDSSVVEENDQCAAVSSYIKPKTLELHEDISILGTGITLHYNSARTSDFHHIIKSNVSRLSLPDGVIRMHAVLEVAGNRFEQLFAPSVMQNVEFIWDGRDVRGVAVKGEVKARLKIGYEYASNYASAGNIAASGLRPDQVPPTWAQFGNESLGVTGRQNIIKWSESVISLFGSPKSEIANGWSISNHHLVDSHGNIYRGDGEIEKGSHASPTVSSGLSLSAVDGDDGYYGAPGRDISYAVTKYGYLYDINTRLNWQIKATEQTFSKSEAIEYCESLDFGGPWAGRWRLPSVKELLYTLDKSGREHEADAYTLNSYNNVWGANTIDEGQRKQALCVAGRGLNHDSWTIITDDMTPYNYAMLSDSLRLIGYNDYFQLYWQDTPDNISLKMTWREAINYCETLEHAGMTNWRLPTANELLMQGGTKNFLFKSPVGHNGDPDAIWRPYVEWRKPYWSSTPNVGAPELEAWAIEVTMGTGYHAYGQEEEQYHVRCVSPYQNSVVSPYIIENGKHVKTTDKLTGTLLSAFSYSETTGELTSIRDRFGNQVRLIRDEQGKVSQIVSPSGMTTSLDIDEHSNLRSVTYPDGTGYQLDYQGELLNHQIDPNGNVFERFFDAHGRITRSLDPEDGEWRFYSRLDEATQAKIYGYTTAENNRFEVKESANGGTETYYPDGSVESSMRSFKFYNNRLVPTSHQKVGGMEYLVHSKYDPIQKRNVPRSLVVRSPGGVESKTDITRNGDGHVVYFNVEHNDTQKVTMRYHVNSGKSTTTTRLGRETVLKLDTARQIPDYTEVVGFAPIHYSYDGFGRLMKISQGDRSTQYFYSGGYGLRSGLLEKIVGSNLPQVTLTRDNVGQVIRAVLSSSEQQQQATEFGYDNNGNLISITPDGQPEHQFAYNSINNVTSYTAPVAADAEQTVSSYVYDRDRRISEITLPSGENISYVYVKGIDRLESISTPYGRYQLSYNEVGDVIRVNAPDGNTLNYHYDGLLYTGTNWSGDVTGSFSVNYSPGGDVGSVCVNDASCIAYGYDLDGMLTSAGNLTLNRALDKGGVITGTEHFDIQHHISHNQYGEIEEEHYTFGAQNLYQATYQFDDAGRITRKQQFLAGESQVETYLYDGLGRLSTATKGETTQVYRYGANGNRIGIDFTQGDQTTTKSATFDEQDRLTSFAQCRYQYDVNG
uniref:Lcl domain-containing protein n=1 Tax=Pseudoalteromonas sp. PPB1 TaxID=2756136 RepID=UPI001891A36C